jgi:hypothetical protein
MDDVQEPRGSSHLADARDATPSVGLPLDPRRAVRIRERIMGGAYDSLEVVDAMARRLLDHGDL